VVDLGSPFELLPAAEAFTTKPGLSGIVPRARNGRRRHAHFSQSAESQAGMAGSVIKQVAHFKHSVIPGPLEFHWQKPACRDIRQWVVALILAATGMSAYGFVHDQKIDGPYHLVATDVNEQMGRSELSHVDTRDERSPVNPSLGG
jgi:hypothetical protein